MRRWDVPQHALQVVDTQIDGGLFPGSFEFPPDPLGVRGFLLGLEALQESEKRPAAARGALEAGAKDTFCLRGPPGAQQGGAEGFPAR